MSRPPLGWLLILALSGCCFSSESEGSTTGAPAGTTTGTCAGRGPSAATGSAAPGGHCTHDADCPGCGWVCSQPLGDICIQSMTGDPGACAVDADCACPCQSCDAGQCTPSAHPQCACNSDCPIGEICDQLLFTCHAQPESGLSCGGFHESGSCGCGFICGGGSSDPACQAPIGEPECYYFDCNTCETGELCLPKDAGLPPGCQPVFASGWCH